MAIVTGVVRTNWSGTTGGPGLTQLAIEGATDPHTWDAAAAQVAVDAVRAFWVAIQALIPDNIKLDVSPVVDVYNAASGELVGSYSAAVTPAQVTGASAGNFMMAAGIKVNLNTGQIRNGRRVRGSIFIVPIQGTSYTADGLVIGTTRTLVNSSLNTMRTTLTNANKQLAVWSRPIPEGKPRGPRAGVTTAVTSVETSEKGAILRGRRD
jgi:hypothetical protein